jgi:acyl transferase domain-containing protein
MFIGLDRAHLLSPTGQCKPFDASADGYARSEGCGIFVLKRLSDAQSENDNILGVIRGIEVNQSGLTHSITHPHFPTQTTLFKQLLDRSGMQPCRVNVVEAHGTGTVVGDPVEVASIRNVFGAGRTANDPLYITSIKGNIGHLEAASGVAGLAKLLLMLENRVIPRQVSFRLLNPDIVPLDVDHTVIPTQQVIWAPQDGMTRVALLNNFGAAGSNTALLVEENIPSYSRTTVDPGMIHVFGFSAKSEIALRELRSRYLQWLRSPVSESVRLIDIAYSMTARRQIHPFRLVVSASDRSSLIANLNKASPVHTSSALSKVIFVFSGQGSQYLGMGRSLYQTSSVFKCHLDHCHSILISLGFLGVLQIITATPNGDSSSSNDRFEEHQTAIVALEYALARLWISWGLDPIAVIGHRSAAPFSEYLIANDDLYFQSWRIRSARDRGCANTRGRFDLGCYSSSLNGKVLWVVLHWHASRQCAGGNRGKRAEIFG